MDLRGVRPLLQFRRDCTSRAKAHSKLSQSCRLHWSRLSVRHMMQWRTESRMDQRQAATDEVEDLRTRADGHGAATETVTEKVHGDLPAPIHDNLPLAGLGRRLQACHLGVHQDIHLHGVHHTHTCRLMACRHHQACGVAQAALRHRDILLQADLPLLVVLPLSVDLQRACLHWALRQLMAPLLPMERQVGVEAIGGAGGEKKEEVEKKKVALLTSTEGDGGAKRAEVAQKAAASRLVVLTQGPQMAELGKVSFRASRRSCQRRRRSSKAQ
mmetsp:Transcript_45784/g.106337  ORF Transcript_45784/g.106337 Transcript_45784/m.106337 type:complete len:271 (+) Transcript_45784:1957-2769(+)